MAVGDAVTEFINQPNTNFQPASGVEICITSVTSNTIQLYDGTNTIALPAVTDSLINSKIFIDNGVYLRTQTTTVFVTGVQTK